MVRELSNATTFLMTFSEVLHPHFNCVDVAYWCPLANNTFFLNVLVWMGFFFWLEDRKATWIHVDKPLMWNTTESN